MAIVAYGEITILDLIDTATYIYYSANSDGSGATSSPQPNTKYIGIYSGKPITGGRPSVAPSGTTWTKYVGDDGAQGPQGAQGEQGYSFVASVSRPNFREEQWQTYGTIGRSEWWTDTSNIRNGCRIGDIFTVVGTATDTRNSHIIYFKSLSNSGDLYGTCISHAIAERGAPGQNGTNGTNGKDGKDGKDGQDGQMFYATCSTEAGAVTKVANLSGTGVFRLETGASVTVNFTNQNTASNPKLEIKAGTSSYGAKDIWVNGKSMTNDIYYWEKEDSLVFVYDGQHWNLTNASATIKANSFAVKLEGVEDKADDAAKTATNFLYFDTNGLQVGYKNSSGSWAGNRTQMTSNSFNILDVSGNALASFGANVINLGNNGSDAKINFNNGFLKLETSLVDVKIGYNDDGTIKTEKQKFSFLNAQNFNLTAEQGFNISCMKEVLGTDNSTPMIVGSKQVLLYEQPIQETRAIIQLPQVYSSYSIQSYAYEKNDYSTLEFSEIKMFPGYINFFVQDRWGNKYTPLSIIQGGATIRGTGCNIECDYLRFGTGYTENPLSSSEISLNSYVSCHGPFHGYFNGIFDGYITANNAYINGSLSADELSVDGDITITGEYKKGLETLLFPRMMSAICSTELALSTSHQRIDCSNVQANTSSTFFFFFNGGIKCNFSGYALVMGCAYAQELNVGNNLGVRLYQNSTWLSSARAGAAKPQVSCLLPPRVCKVSEGDTFYMHVLNHSEAKGKIPMITNSTSGSTNSSVNTILTVMYLGG